MNTLSTDRIPVIIRPARASDKAGMLEVTRNIWDGHDYLPSVWDEWLADNEGMLCVALGKIAAKEDCMVGLGKLTHLGGDNWWMEGMRVQPEYQGRGIAAQLHEYLVNFWLEYCGGVVRLTTSSNRLPIHHLCERTGFTRIGERTFFTAPAIQAGPADQLPFQLLTAVELPAALDFLLNSPTLAFSEGLIDLGWRHARPGLEQMQTRLENGKLWWWGERQGLLSFWEDNEDEEVTPSLKFLACSPGEASALLLDYRRLAGFLGYAKATWMAPLHPVLLPLLEQAGFTRDWEDSLFLYARAHGGKIGG
jgi:GNAT superfamily N-acetyltransferase